MNKLSRNEWQGISIGFALGFILCLIGIGFWPPGLEGKHEYGANYSTEGHSTYYEISKTWEEWRAAIWERTSEDPVAFYTLVLSVFTAVLAIATIRVWFVTKALVDGAKDTAERQLRAYIGITGAPILEGADEWIIAVDYWNHGQTPAHDVRGSISVQVLAIDPYPVFPPAEEWPGSWVMVPNAHATPDRSVALLEHEGDIVSGRKAIFAWGHISYRDVFNWQIKVTFRYRLRPKIDGSGWQLHPEQDGNETTYENIGLSK
jgi:hypothetical protein